MARTAGKLNAESLDPRRLLKIDDAYEGPHCSIFRCAFFQDNRCCSGCVLRAACQYPCLNAPERCSVTMADTIDQRKKEREGRIVERPGRRKNCD